MSDKLPIANTDEVDANLFHSPIHHRRFLKMLKMANTVNEHINKGDLVFHGGQRFLGFDFRLSEATIYEPIGVQCEATWAGRTWYKDKVFIKPDNLKLFDDFLFVKAKNIKNMKFTKEKKS